MNGKVSKAGESYRPQDDNLERNNKRDQQEEEETSKEDNGISESEDTVEISDEARKRLQNQQEADEDNE